MIRIKSLDSILHKTETEGKRARQWRDRERESLCERQRVVEKER